MVIDFLNVRMETEGVRHGRTLKRHALPRSHHPQAGMTQSVTHSPATRGERCIRLWCLQSLWLAQHSLTRGARLGDSHRRCRVESQ